MDSFITFLIVGGAILLAVYKEANKNKKADKAQHKSIIEPPPPPVISPVDEKRTLSDTSKKRDTDLNGFPSIFTTDQPSTSPKNNFKKKESVSVAASLAKSAEQDKINEALRIKQEQAENAEQPNEEYAIRSTEDVRKAIVWGEILNRKY